MIRYPRACLVAVGLVVIVAGAWGWALPSLLSNRPGDFYAHPSESLRANVELETARKRSGNLRPGLAAIVDGGIAAENRTEQRLAAMPQVEKAKKAYRSKSGRSGLLFVWLRPDLPEEKATRVAEMAEAIPGVSVGGPAISNRWLSASTGNTVRKAELIALPLLLLAGLWIFGGVIAALLPVAVGGSVLLVAFGCLRLANQVAPLSIFSLSVGSALALGLSVDYSLLMLSRFREELDLGSPVREAVRRTLRTAGRTVAISSATIATSFACLLLIPVPFARSIGAGGALVALVAGAVSVLSLPPFFLLAGGRVNALAVRKTRGASSASAWRRLARFVLRNPVPIATVTGACLVLLALPALGIRLTGFDETSLPRSAPQRVFSERMEADFSSSVVNEVRVAIRHPRNQEDIAVQEAISHAAEGLAVPFPIRFAVGPTLFEDRFSPLPPTFSHRAEDLIERLRAVPGNVAIGGKTASYMDLTRTLEAKAPLAFAVLVLALFPLLLLATRSVVLFVKVMIMNLLSLGAALGLVVAIFQTGKLENLLGYQSQDALVVILPVVMTMGCVGLVTDYGLFLLMRIREAREAGHPDGVAISIGLERTGPTITAAAALFSLGVLPFAASEVVFVKEIAVGIVAAVLIDAFVVRPLLVPSLMMILGPWNWWPSKDLMSASAAFDAVIPQRGDRQ